MEKVNIRLDESSQSKAMSPVWRVEISLSHPKSVIYLCLATFTVTVILMTAVTMAPNQTASYYAVDHPSLTFMGDQNVDSLNPPLPIYHEDEEEAVWSTEGMVESEGCHTESVDLFPLTDMAIKEADRWGGELQKVFFLETSGSSRLSPRAACSIESTADNSDLFVLVMVLSPYLDLTDNTTCQLYKHHSSHNVRFYRILPSVDFKNTQFYDLFKNDLFAASEHSIVHMSDALRLIYVYKYGGWYMDTDVITLKSLSNMTNVLAASALDPQANFGRYFHITNGAFNLEKNHPLLTKYMSIFRQEFRGVNRAEVGPMKLTLALRMLCKFGPKKRLMRLNEPPLCHNLTILHPDVFYPFRIYQAMQMWQRDDLTSTDLWDSRIERSVSVHFYGGMSRKRELAVSGDPLQDTYSYLAPKFCPLSYYSSPVFSY